MISIDPKRLLGSLTADRWALYLADVPQGPMSVVEAKSGNYNHWRDAEEILDAILVSARTGLLSIDDKDPSNFVTSEMAGTEAVISPATTFNRGCIKSWLEDADTVIPDWLNGKVDGSNAHQHDATDLEARLAETEKKLKESLAEIEALKALVPPFPVNLMKIAIEAQREHWADFDPVTEAGRANQEATLSALQKEYGLSMAQARAVEAVASPIIRKKTKKP